MKSSVGMPKTSRIIMDDNVKKAHLMTTFRDYALTWFMKYYDPSLATGAPTSFFEIRNTLKSEFKKLKSESQCITKLKEIKHKQLESMWDFD